MKKGKILNPNLSHLIASMGHTDGLCIADAGLPIPTQIERVDLAVTHGLPKFLDVLDVILTDFAVESIVLAEEIKENNPEMHIAIKERFSTREIKIAYVSHDLFKSMTKECRGIVRTGECSPYANIILQSGVEF